MLFFIRKIEFGIIYKYKAALYKKKCYSDLQTYLCIVRMSNY